MKSAELTENSTQLGKERVDIARLFAAEQTSDPADDFANSGESSRGEEPPETEIQRLADMGDCTRGRSEEGGMVDAARKTYGRTGQRG